MAEMFEELKAQMRELTGEAAAPTDVAGNVIAPQQARTTWRLTSALGKVFGGGLFWQKTKRQ
jgi:hypothetical protein